MENETFPSFRVRFFSYDGNEKTKTNLSPNEIQYSSEKGRNLRMGGL